MPLAFPFPLPFHILSNSGLHSQPCTGALWPTSIRDSFVAATHELRITKTDRKNPSDHALWQDAVSADNLDFDWAVWLVLRTIYYDTVDKMESRLSFKNGLAVKKITERYQGIDIFNTWFPIIWAPRPSKWGRIASRSASNPESRPIGQGDSQPNTINPSIQPSGINRPVPALNHSTPINRQPEADEAVTNSHSAGGVTVTQVQNPGSEDFRFVVNIQAREFLQRHPPSVAHETESIVEQVKLEMQTWVTQQIQSAMNTVKEDLIKTIRDEIAERCNEAKTDLKPWIIQTIDTTVTDQRNQEKAKKADLKRSFEAFQKSQQDN
ncbi:hypothetical protein FPOAC1_006417 [Fusarium poae]|uniref:hypothetical protein n=1 Tax=Fusarium poae TaxID=36050 RepID=UPI001CE77758|nr:hypothetical protein FPOAC1_006417 [Fusarium poae]KAG8673114.1 hypothetical protein FPOAC1_006417 [Fusarium poae]